MPSHDTADRTVHAGFDSIDTGEEISLRDDVLVSIGQSQEMRPGEAKIAVKVRQHGFAALGRRQTGGKSSRASFIDAPESETAWRDRLAEQAEYFGITIDQAATVAREAAAYTSKKLAGTFTVWTRWRDALGRSALGRVFAIVIVNGRDLNELLVANGLARIYGTRTPLPDGRDSRTYLARLTELEASAKRERKGAWRFAK
jgi:endonuclease YncB( thermonuclease family)